MQQVQKHHALLGSVGIRNHAEFQVSHVNNVRHLSHFIDGQRHVPEKHWRFLVHNSDFITAHTKRTQSMLLQIVVSPIGLIF